MARKAVVKMGNLKLATPSDAILDIDKSYTELLMLIQDMKDTMDEEGGIGIAAPQIGCNKRVIIFGFEDSPRYPQEKSIPFTVLINPSMKILAPDIVDGWEGCLSVPGLRGLVPRYNHIEYKGYDLHGNTITRIVDGFHARVFQHEYDHLEGVLYPRRIKDLRFFGFEDELMNNLEP